MSTGFYLLDHRPPRPANWYTSRRAPLRVIVMHITAGLEDLDGVNDHSAENTARYAATVTDRRVSWHSGSDADTHFPLLPASYTAFHCRGYNSSTYGHEISKRHSKWSGMDPEWVGRTLRQAALAVGPVAKKAAIPRRLLSKAEVDRGMSGFTSHAFLDPTRRSDPGPDFPWARFFQLIDGTPAPPEEDMPLTEDEISRIADRTKTWLTEVLWDFWRNQHQPYLHSIEARLAELEKRLPPPQS